MFPVSFSDGVINDYSDPGETVLDPFAGRGTAIFSAATQGRRSIGIEINPVGYVYSGAKLEPAAQYLVENRLEELNELSGRFSNEARCLPRFFHRCFSRRVRRFLLSARTNLDWQRSQIDRTVAALLLVHLHGKAGTALSNQMRQTKSMSPQYAVRWWDERGLQPPDIDPIAFMKKRLAWRYAKGIPNTTNGKIYLGNSIDVLGCLENEIYNGAISRARLLFTSPPYHSITNYHYDQWIRLWLLGGRPNASLSGNGRGGRFSVRDRYVRLLDVIFSKAARLLEKDAIIYVRTDRREFTYRTTRSVLRKVFPDKHFIEIDRPMQNPSQTRLFGGKYAKEIGKGEVDMVLLAR